VDRSRDLDPVETREWLDSLNGVPDVDRPNRVHFLLEQVIDGTRRKGAAVPYSATTPYVNTIPVERQEPNPGDRFIEHRIRSAVCWNALAIVLKANKESSELGGHIASFQSAATLYDTGFMSGRSLSLGRDEGLTKVRFDEATDRIIGCSIVGPSAGDLIAKATLAIEMGADAQDIGLTIHLHPTLSETIGMAAEAFEGTINEEMKLAAVRAIAELAQVEQSDVVTAAYGTQDISFGPDYLIPRPFDPRLITKVAPAVAQTAMESGVATRPLPKVEKYRRSLQRFVYTSGTVMQPVFAAAAESGRKRIVYAEGEDDRVLRAARVVVDESLATPILVGRPDVITQKISALGLRLQPARNIEIVSFDNQDSISQFADTYYQRRKRHSLSHDVAAAEVRRNSTLIGAMLLCGGQADGLLCGTFGADTNHLRYLEEVIGLAEGAHSFAAMSLLQLPRHTVFICDPYIHLDPSAEEIAEMAVLAVAELRSFGQTPRIALVSHSNFGTASDPSARKMRDALELIYRRAPDLEVEGEMHADAALSKPLLKRIFPDARLSAEANLLIIPNLDAANATFNALKIVAGQGISVAPILLGAAKPAHILTPMTTVRGIVNMTALTAVAVGPASHDK
jgi:phosphotransacetylase